MPDEIVVPEISSSAIFGPEFSPVEINTRHLVYFIVAFLLVYVAGLSVDVMNVDAAQYASMSREMAETGDWLEVKNRYGDYLDKPPLLFWLSAMSFKVFGISNWAYKLPSFLFAILGIFSTMKLGALLYDRRTGAVAGIMTASALGVFIMTNDIRTDTMLFGSTVFAIWQILVFVRTKRWLNLVAGFAGIGLAMLAKGPLGLVLPAIALSCEFAYKREWRNFVRWQWIPGLLIVAVLLLPMCWGLYHQFDLHPEKTVNGSTGVSGLKFYFWTQSFGRITGDSDWGTKFDNGAGPFFFTHTFLWAFFPWSIFVIGGLVKTLVVLVKSRFRPGALPEFLSAGGFVLLFIALSASKYKLPHYIYVTVPLAALIAAHFLVHDVLDLSRKFLYYLFRGFSLLFFVSLAAVCCMVLTWFFPGAGVLVYTVTGAWLLAGVIFAWKLHDPFQKLMYPLLAGLLAFYFVGNIHFYPNLLKYQSANTAGRIVHESNVPRGAFYTYSDIFEHALDYYSRRAVFYTYMDSTQVDTTLRKYGNMWIYTDEAGYEKLKTSPYKIVSVKEFEDYPTQFLTTNFLNPETRPGVLRKRYLVVITK